MVIVKIYFHHLSVYSLFRGSPVEVVAWGLDAFMLLSAQECDPLLTHTCCAFKQIFQTLPVHKNGKKTDRVTKYELTDACESRSDKLAFVREGKGLLRVLQEK